MFGLFARALAIALAAILLTACGTRPRQMPEVQQIYEIRAVTVTADAGAPRAMLRGIKQRIDRAIRESVRPVPMPRAVMNIHILSVTRSAGYDGMRTQTDLSVTLTDVPSGQPVLTRGFVVYSFSLGDRGADNAAAEAIAARLRVEYALHQPAIRSEPVYQQPHISTRMKSEERPAIVREDKPIVIPLKTAPGIGADQDPVLNSKTRVAPEKKSILPEAKLKTADPTPAENVLESGAKAKVVIKPAAVDPAADEPCVETMDKKC